MTPSPTAHGWLTFLSDFGFEDPFLGVCKGVIGRTAPEVRVLDVIHLVEPQDVEQGAAAVRPPAVDDDHVHGEVVTVDHFGNLTLNLQRAHLETAGISVGQPVELRCSGKARTVPFLTTYGEAEPGALVVCEDSFSTVTVAVNSGSAAADLRVRRGDPVVIARQYGAGTGRR